VAAVPDSTSVLSILIDVKNAATGAGQIRDVGKAAETTGTQAEQSGQGFGGMAKNLAVAAGGAVAVKKGFDFFKGAAVDAGQLAKNTAALTRTTGMDTKTASAWVSVAKSRGIETDTLNKSFTVLSKQLRAAEGGSKSAVKAFDDLGISAESLKGMKTEDAILAVADSFEKLPAGADKAAIAQQLFGRQSQALLPLLNSGSKGIQEQLATMEKYGLTMDESGVKKALELSKAQREMTAAVNGVKMSIGQALVPVLVAAASALKPLIDAFSWGVQNIPGFSYVVLALVAALGGLLIAATLSSMFGALAAVFGVTTGALVALIGTALVAALPFIAIGVAIAALVAGLVIAYNKIGWFRNGVNAAFGAVKSAGVAAFDAIKAAIAAVVGAFTSAVGAVKSAIDGIISAVKAMVEPITTAVGKVKDVLGGIGSAVGSVGGAIGSVLPFQHGGIYPAGGGMALVGERGPELLQLPGGARVTPLQGGTTPGVDFGRMFGEIHVHLDVEGRELAHVVARENWESQAKR
jgi:hypothetical protein